MKILLVNNLYPPHTRGGAEQVVVAETRGLREAGHDVVVLTAEPFRGFRSLGTTKSIEDGIRVLRFYPLNLFFYANDHKHNTVVRLMWHFWNLINPHSALVFWRAIKHERPDAIHFHNINGIGFLLPLIATMARGGSTKQSPKTALTLHGLQYAIPDGIMTVGHEQDFRVSGFLVRWYGRVVSALLGSIQTVISPSQYLLDFYSSRGFFQKQKKIVLRNPPPHFHAVPQSSVADGRMRILYVGQIEDHKGIFFLLSVIPSLPRDLVLTIIGDGTQVSRLKEHTKNDLRIHFIGPVSHDKLGQYYASADFLIFPSLYYENMPMVIAEAFAHGLPVIAAHIGGVGELVEDGNTGFLFVPGDAESLREAVAQALQSRHLWTVLRVAATKKADEYHLDRYIAQLIGVYTRGVDNL